MAPAKSALEPFELTVGGGEIDVRFAAGRLAVRREAISKWISDAAQAVNCYYGRFPVSRTGIEIRPVSSRSGVLNGVTFGDPVHTSMEIGELTNEAILDSDWTMTHELVHLAFPNVPESHHWIEEGIATYVEPIARAQAGKVSVEKVWSDMLHDMPKGEPGPSSRGLDQTNSWANTYWAGALFCLFADVEFRERTGNRLGLQDALRGILNAGGNITADWPIEKAFRAGDAAAGVPVLSELYARLKDKPVWMDLPAVWRRLGISEAGGIFALLPDAELSAIRRAITARRS
jgi:hypothetical protein